MQISALVVCRAATKPKYTSAIHAPYALCHFCHQEGSWTAVHPMKQLDKMHIDFIWKNKPH